MDNTGPNLLPWSFLKAEPQPWAFGFNPQAATPQARVVWAALSSDLQLALSTHSPFAKLRGQAVFELSRRGMTGRLLAELTGLSTSSISRIVVRGRKCQGQNR